MKIIPKWVSIIVVLASGYTITLYIRAAMWENEVANQVSILITEIAKPWSTENILNHASFALKASPYENIKRKQEGAALYLGNAVKVTETPKCNLMRGKDTYSHKEFIYASCQMRVEFEKQTVDLTARVVNQENQWLIDDFYVENLKVAI